MRRAITKCVVTLTLCGWENSFGHFERLWFIILELL